METLVIPVNVLVIQVNEHGNTDDPGQCIGDPGQCT